MTEPVSMPEIIIDAWPEQRLSQQELLASLAYLAYKTGKPVRLRKYTPQQHLTARMVILYVCTRDTCPCPQGMPAVEINGTEYPFADSQPGFQIDGLAGAEITDARGLVLAKVNHNCITVLVEFTGEDNGAARAVLARVVEKAVGLVGFDVEDAQAERERLLRERFEDWLRTTVRSLLDEKKYELARLEQDIERAYRQIVESERRRPLLEEEIENLTRLQKVPHPRLARTQTAQLLRLQERGLYEDIVCSQARSFVATTGPIVIEYDGRSFPLGRYEVTIEPTGMVRIKNLTEHPGAEHPHPHIGADGNPCLGNVHGDVARLIGRMRIAEALQVLHRFLCSYNRDGAYETIAQFDPTGEYVDEDEDPCRDCDERCSPWCINRCEHNDGYFGCGDCYDYRSEFCYLECEYNEGYELVHPCEGCDQASTNYCYLECPYNRDWQLQNPCDNCGHPECTTRCSYYEKRQEVEANQ